MKVLLTDDDTFLLDMYSTKFREAGHEVHTAHSGEEALQVLADEGPFDAILFDMVMPGLTGLDLLEKIKTEKVGGSDLYCIVLSNQGEQSDIAAATQAGADGYIIKAESVPSEVITKVTEIVSS